MSSNTLSPAETVALLLIAAGLCWNPDVGEPAPPVVPEGEDPPPPKYPVYVSKGMAWSEVAVVVNETGSVNEPRTHAGHQVSRPIVRIDFATDTYEDTYKFGQRLQAFCDADGSRSVSYNSKHADVENIARQSAVQNLGMHPKTKKYMGGVNVELAIPSVTPAAP